MASLARSKGSDNPRGLWGRGERFCQRAQALGQFIARPRCTDANANRGPGRRCIDRERVIPDQRQTAVESLT